jgi:hypothetical protein
MVLINMRYFLGMLCEDCGRIAARNAMCAGRGRGRVRWGNEKDLDDQDASAGSGLRDQAGESSESKMGDKLWKRDAARVAVFLATGQPR